MKGSFNLNYVLGISAYYHDSAAAIVCNGEIIAAAQEERFSRKKHDASFPKQAIEYCIKEANINIEDLDAVVFYEKPFFKIREDFGNFTCIYTQRRRYFYKLNAFMG